ncbi:hypothetical protein ACA910_016645 [Epithemia clementina (nom. ined.)]
MRDNTASYSYSYNFTPKEAALYAVSVGYGSSLDSYTRELCYVWEKHKNFLIVPTFAFSFSFWSIPTEQADSNRPKFPASLPEFPPPMMKQMGLIPSHCLLEDNIEVEDYPVLHTWQSITWHSPFTCEQIFREAQREEGTHCCTCCLKGRFLSVQPKSVGTFVTTETHVTDKLSGSPLCTLRSTALIYGLDEALVNPMPMQRKDSTHKPPYMRSNPTRNPCLERDFEVATNQALLYRLASGDSNGIHVDFSLLPSFASDNEDNDSKQTRPILHGLATLAMGTRILDQCIFEKLGCGCEFAHLEASFRKPVFLGETLRLRIWWLGDDQKLKKTGLDFEVAFTVVKAKSGEICITRGLAKLKTVHNKARL